MEGASSIPKLAADSRDAMSTDQSSRSSKKRAKVWEFVESEVVNGIDKAICKFCRLNYLHKLGKAPLI
jgi:hypothetical protein